MNALIEMLGQPWAQRVGYALVHFLWQGAAVAAMLWLALRLLRRRRPQARYLAACAAMLLLVAAPVATLALVHPAPPAGAKLTPIFAEGKPIAVGLRVEFDRSPVDVERLRAGGLRVFDHKHPLTGDITDMFDVRAGEGRAMELRFKPGMGDFGLGNAVTVSTDSPLPLSRGGQLPPLSLTCRTDRADQPPQSRMDRLAAWLAPALPWAVLAWFAGAVICAVRHIGGWIKVQRLRRSGAPLADAGAEGAWLAAAKSLAARLRLRRPVRLLRVARLAGPVVVGALKPAVLVPAAVLTGLAPQHIEAVLAHELAHVRRHDYLVNLLQTLVETLLFYHPAVWWVSARIRAEREHCCDDLAVATCGDRLTYANALATLAFSRETQASASADSPVRQDAQVSTGPAVAAAGPRLLPRIRRVLGLAPGDRPRRPLARAGIVGVLVLSAALVLPLACLRPTAQGPDAKPATQPASAPGDQPSTARPCTMKDVTDFIQDDRTKVTGDWEKSHVLSREEKAELAQMLTQSSSSFEVSKLSGKSGSPLFGPDWCIDIERDSAPREHMQIWSFGADNEPPARPWITWTYRGHAFVSEDPALYKRMVQWLRKKSDRVPLPATKPASAPAKEPVRRVEKGVTIFAWDDLGLVVRPDPDKLARYGLSLDEFAKALEKFPLGQGGFTLNSFSLQNSAGRNVWIRNVATIEAGPIRTVKETFGIDNVVEASVEWVEWDKGSPAKGKRRTFAIKDKATLTEIDKLLAGTPNRSDNTKTVIPGEEWKLIFAGKDGKAHALFFTHTLIGGPGGGWVSSPQSKTLFDLFRKNRTQQLVADRANRSAKMQAENRKPATAPAGGLGVKDRQAMLLEAVNADPPDVEKMRRALTDVGNAEFRFVKGPLEVRPAEKSLPRGVSAQAKDGKWLLYFTEALNRTQRGAPPQELLDRLVARRKDGYKLMASRLYIAPTDEIVKERDRLFKEADTNIRKGLLALAQKYPRLKETAYSGPAVIGPEPQQTLAQQLQDKQPWPGDFLHISVYLKELPGAQSRKGGPGVRAYYKLLHVHASGEPVAAAATFFPADGMEHLAVEGGRGSDTDDAKLDAAAHRVIDDALAPLMELNKKAAAEAGDSPATAPAGAWAGAADVIHGTAPRGFQSVVYGNIDKKTGMCRLMANGARMRQLKVDSRPFEFLELWRFDPSRKQWDKLAVPARKAVRIEADPKRTVYGPFTDQVLIDLTDKVGLYWGRWLEDGSLVQEPILCGPIMPEDYSVAPPPKGMVVAGIPYEDRAEVRYIPDPVGFFAKHPPATQPATAPAGQPSPGPSDRPLPEGEVKNTASAPVAGAATAPADSGRWVRVAKTPADRAGMYAATEKVASGVSHEDALAVTERPRPAAATLGQWFDRSHGNRAWPGEDDENVLLFRSRQVDDRDLMWIDRVERQGDRFIVHMRRARCLCEYAKNIRYHQVFAVNLGKLPPGKYTCQWSVELLTFTRLGEDGWPADAKAVPGKPTLLTGEFEVHPSRLDSLVAAMRNDHVRWEVSPAGFAPRLGPWERSLLHLGQKAVPALRRALEDKDKFAAAHVVLTMIAEPGYRTTAEGRWHGLRVERKQHGVGVPNPEQIPELAAMWKKAAADPHFLTDELAEHRVIRFLAANMPKGWEMTRGPTRGKVSPALWDAGEGVKYAWEDRDAPRGSRTRGQLILTIMGSGYEAKKPHEVPDYAQMGPDREIAKWRGRRVFVGASNGNWPDMEKDVLAILKDTDLPAPTTNSAPASAPAAKEIVGQWSEPGADGLQTRIVLGPSEFVWGKSLPIRVELRHKAGKELARATAAWPYIARLSVGQPTHLDMMLLIDQKIDLKFNTVVPAGKTLIVYQSTLDIPSKAASRKPPVLRPSAEGYQVFLDMLPVSADEKAKGKADVPSCSANFRLGATGLPPATAPAAMPKPARSMPSAPTEEQKQKMRTWVSDLKSNDPRKMDEAIRGLGQMGETAAGAVEQLAGLLSDSRVLTYPSDDIVGRTTFRVNVRAAQALCNIGKAAVPSLSAALANKDPMVRQTAARALSEIGQPVKAEFWIRALPDDNKHVGVIAARELGKAKEPSSVDPLVAALKEGDMEVRIEAAKALGEIGDKKAIVPLIEALSGAPQSKYAPSYALAKIGRPAITALIEGFGKLDEKAKGPAAAAIQHCDARLLIDVLLPCLKNRHWQLREAALYAMLKHRMPQTLDAAKDLIGDPHWNVRWTATRSLGEMVDEKTLESTRKMLRKVQESDSDSRVRDCASQALERMGARFKPTATRPAK